MTAITLFYQRLMLSGKDDFQYKHQKILDRAKRDYNDLFCLTDSGNKNSQIMLFRFGYTGNIVYRTLRQEFNGDRTKS